MQVLIVQSCLLALFADRHYRLHHVRYMRKTPLLFMSKGVFAFKICINVDYRIKAYASMTASVYLMVTCE
jgi:hypothetical protein